MYNSSSRELKSLFWPLEGLFMHMNTHIERHRQAYRQIKKSLKNILINKCSYCSCFVPSKSHKNHLTFKINLSLQCSVLLKSWKENLYITIIQLMNILVFIFHSYTLFTLHYNYLFKHTSFFVLQDFYPDIAIRINITFIKQCE